MATTNSGGDNSTQSYFASLLEQSRKLREETDAADLPPIQLGLGEIERRAKELKKSKLGAQKDIKAEYLLLAGGVNTDEALRNLESFEAQTVYEPAPMTLDTDLEAYLRSRKEQNILSSIEDGIQRTARDFDTFVAKNVTMDWDQQKNRIFEHFGLLPRSDIGDTLGTSTFGATTYGRATQQGRQSTLGSTSVWAKSMRTSILGKPAQENTGPLFQDIDVSRQLEISRPALARLQEYPGAVRKLNEARTVGTLWPVISNFQAITAASGTDVLTVQLTDSWKILQNITQEPADASPFEGALAERCFAKMHMNVNPDGPEAVPLKNRVESGARRHLEALFYRHVEETIEKNPMNAKLGGVPTTVAKFKAYFNCKASAQQWGDKTFDLTPDSTPVWALVFYLIRAGLVQDALAYVKDNHQIFTKIDRNFFSYLNAYAKDPDRRLTRLGSEKIRSDYIQLVRDIEDVDMFRIALYKVIGRCELSKRTLSEVLPTAEDWMWLQLVLTRETERSDDQAHEVFKLGDLQKSVLQYGVKHFNNKTSNVGLYFQMLIMSGLFEHAIQYLYSFQPVDAVHFAIALTYYGLLGVSSAAAQSSENNLLTIGPHGDYQINFARMIGQYIRDFRTQSVVDSVDYLCLICLNSDLPAPDGVLQLSLCHEALREIALESKEFTKLLGDVRADGTRDIGAIEKRMKLIKLTDQQEFLRTITEQAAAQADDDGRISDAVLLYHLAEDYDTVVQVINKSLSDWVASEDPTQLSTARHIPEDQVQHSITEYEDPTELGKHMLNLYMGAAPTYKVIAARNREALLVLLKIADAKKEFMIHDYERCLRSIRELKIIPIDNEVEVGAIRKKAQNFGENHEAVARNVGMLLKLAVDCCYQLANSLKESPYMDATRMQMLQEYRAQVKCAMIYAGIVQYKLPTNVYEFITFRDENM